MLARYAVFQELLGIAEKPELKLGSRGRRVTELKVDLAAWYDRHLPGEWEKFKIKSGPYYGEKLVVAVRDFQTRVGLGIDGVTGENTRGALERDTKPKRR